MTKQRPLDKELTGKQEAQQYFNSLKRADHFPVSESIPAAFEKGYQKALEERWIDCNDKLPLFTREHTGNKLSDLVIVSNGSEQFICYLEAVRPDFKTLIWSFEYHFQNMPHDFDVENLEYKGSPITHWMELPAFPNPKENA